MAKIEDIQARSIDRVFDSKEKAIKYVLKHKDDNLGNIRGIDWDIENGMLNENMISHFEIRSREFNDEELLSTLQYMQECFHFGQGQIFEG